MDYCKHGNRLFHFGQECWYDSNGGHCARWYDEEPKVNLHVKSGPGYTLSANHVTGKLQSEVHNSSRLEPALGTGAILTSVAGIVGFVRLIWPNLVSADIWEMIFYLIALFIPIVTAARIRGKVWSPSSVSEVLKEALAEADKLKK